MNSILPGIIVTPLVLDKLNGPRGDPYKNMFANSPAKRPGTADEVGALAEFIMGTQRSFIADSDFLIDGGATATFYYNK